MSVNVLLPTGEAASFPLSDTMTVEQLRDKAVDQTRRKPGFNCVSANNARLIFEGKTLENPSSMSGLKLLPSSVLHLTLRVHGG
ncbi:polyubiquitin-like [Betta splendens]|uniref:Polyubiquitin-like n=1 Tax=Betta splendens TaxID=158456 RepID=A0A6P7LLM7_BETSP|nr:polyubiquitin-like [Betta splendens]